MKTSNGVIGGMRKWRRYPSYKESSVEWLGSIPLHWNKEPLKYITRFVNGAPFKPSDWGDVGTPIIRIENLNGGLDFNRTTLSVDARYLVRKDDLLFAWSGNRGTSFGPFLWTHDGEFYLNQHIFRLEGFKLRRNWFYWLLKGVTEHVESQAHGIIGLVHITKQDLGGIRVPVVPSDEQAQIAAFLDRQTAQIDALITKKERLIELLDEKRTALISHVVTNGLDRTVPMKDSGDRWVGRIPAHWTPKKVKYLFRFAKRLNHPDLKVLSVYRDYGVIEKTTRDDNHNRTPEDLTTYQLVNVADLVINKMKAWQGSLGISILQGITSPDYVVYRSTNNEHLPYLHHRLRIPSMAATFHCISNGIRPDQWRLEPDKFEQLWLFLPPVEEQRRICDYIDRQIAAIDLLGAKVREGIEKLHEYRSALISAAVTGKIDVREEVI